MRRRPHNWPPPAAWAASVEVVSRIYGVERELLTAASRGRGPRPPARVWDAKKMAVYVTVLVSGCDRAELGRLLGYHKDTIATHCAEAERATDTDTGELLSLALERMVRSRLEADAIAEIAARRAGLAMLEETTRELMTVLSSDDQPTKSTPFNRRIPGAEKIVELSKMRGTNR